MTKKFYDFRVENLKDGSVRDGASFMPFRLASSSVESGVNAFINANFSQSVDIVNLHQDIWLNQNVSTLQGPFTFDHVGGLQSRHVRLNLGAVDNITNRPEAWYFDFASNIMTLKGTYNTAYPRAKWSREEGIKRVVNIRNIQTTTASQVQGNYTYPYEVVSVGNRTARDRFFVQNGGVTLPTNLQGLPATTNVRTLLGTACQTEFTLPRRDLTGSQAIITNQFSAPGGIENQSRGFLDIQHEEYSPYNALPWRNYGVRSSASGEASTIHNAFGPVREGLQTLRARYCGRFGIESQYGVPRTQDTSYTASYHKVQRNTQKSVRYNGSQDTVATASRYDNMNIGSSVPRCEGQYAWISASVLETPIGMQRTKDGMISSSAGFISEYIFQSCSSFMSYKNDDGIRTFGVEYATSPTSSEWVRTDFVGLNTNIYEPVSSTIYQLGFTGGPISQYRNDKFIIQCDQEGSASLFNALMLNRNGPYGWPSWKQIRVGEHKVARWLRENSTILMEAQERGNVTTVGRHLVTPAALRGANVAYKEAGVTSKYKPIEQILKVGEETISIKSSYGNTLSKFATPAINKLKSLDGKKKQVYDQVKGMYDGSGKEVRVGTVEELNYEETIFPGSSNAYMNRNRSRTGYTCSFWTTNRAERSAAATRTNSMGFSIVTASMWPLDARLNFAAGVPFQQDGSGELQNGYTTFHTTIYTGSGCTGSMNGQYVSCPVGAVYARRTPETSSTGDAATADSGIIAGDTLWEAGAQSGKPPFFKTYAEWADQLRREGKDCALIPEFRISEHMPTYLRTYGGDFRHDLPGFLTIEGAEIANSTGSEFYKVFSNSDFMEYFDVVKTDHKDLLSPTELKMTCKGYMQLLPYDGFYPACRSVQLATLFSQSYGPHVNYTDSNMSALTKPSGTQASFRTFMTPFFSPGIFFNTIKSGIAVDYPVITSSFKRTERMYETGSNIFCNYAISASLSSSLRFPFEALIEPENYFSNVSIVDLEVHPFSTLDSTASCTAHEQPEYKAAMHNFLAESISFFLKDSSTTTFLSARDDDERYYNCVSGTVYGADFLIRSGKTKSLSEIIDVLNSNNGVELITASQFTRPTISMYSRRSAFGPPARGMLTVSPSGDSYKVYYEGYEHVTPPYYDGLAAASFMFVPSQTRRYSCAEIISTIMSGTDFSNRNWSKWACVCYPPNGLTWDGNFGTIYQYRLPQYLAGEFVDDASSINLKNAAMQGAVLPDACFNFFGTQEEARVEYTQDGRPLSVNEERQGKATRWVIQSKYETPIMDFSDCTHTNPTVGTGSISVGQWHQYGVIPSDKNKGVFSEITDIMPNDITTIKYASLIDLCGFSRVPQRMGEVAQQREISECIVAIPFVEQAGSRVFYRIPRVQIRDALGHARRAGDPTPDQIPLAGTSVRKLVETMNEFVMPPKLDFVEFEEIEPIAMLMFKFAHNLSQQDLVDIWQNCSPEIARNHQYKEVTNQFTFGPSEILQKLDDNTRWMIFKVKKRAKSNYYKMMSQGFSNDRRFEFKFKVGQEGGAKDYEPRFSYSWPYDYCSLVELCKIDAGVKLERTGSGR